jgi:hypothetical protein
MQVLRCMLDRYMTHQSRLASLTKVSFKEAIMRHNGGANQYDGARVLLFLLLF